MKGGAWSARNGWGSRNATAFALAVAIVVAGVVSHAQAAAPAAYVSSLSNLTIAIGGDNVDAIQTTDIVVGDTPRYLAANPSGTRVYVPNQYTPLYPVGPARAGSEVRIPSTGYGSVSVIDTADNTVLTTITDPSFYNPYAVAVSPDGSEVWVANNGSNIVSIIDTATNTVTGTITDGCFYSATGVVFNPVLSRHEAYVVADPDGSGVCIVDTSSREVIDTAYLEYTVYGAEYAVVTPDGSKVYVTGSDVSIIETTSGSYNIRSISPYDLSTVTYLAVSNDGTKVYAAGNEDFLEIIDSSSADFNNDDFTDSYIYFSSAYSINAVTVVPGTDLGLVTDLNEGAQLLAFDTVNDEEILVDGSPASADLSGTPFAIISIGPGGSTPSPPPHPGLPERRPRRRVVRHVRDGRGAGREGTGLRRGRRGDDRALLRPAPVPRRDPQARPPEEAPPF